MVGCRTSATPSVRGGAFLKTPLSFLLVPPRTSVGHWFLEILYLAFCYIKLYKFFSLRLSIFSLPPFPPWSPKLLDVPQHFIHRLCFHLEKSEGEKKKREKSQVPYLSSSVQILSKSCLQPEISPKLLSSVSSHTGLLSVGAFSAISN